MSSIRVLRLHFKPKCFGEIKLITPGEWGWGALLLTPFFKWHLGNKIWVIGEKLWWSKGGGMMVEWGRGFNSYLGQKSF